MIPTFLCRKKKTVQFFYQPLLFMDGQSEKSPSHETLTCKFDDLAIKANLVYLHLLIQLSIQKR